MSFFARLSNNGGDGEKESAISYKFSLDKSNIVAIGEAARQGIPILECPAGLFLLSAGKEVIARIKTQHGVTQMSVYVCDHETGERRKLYSASQPDCTHIRFELRNDGSIIFVGWNKDNRHFR